MEIKATFCYKTSVIPPRCRKPRQVEVLDETTVRIPVASYDEAPLAMRHSDLFFPKRVDYRYYDNCLYKRVPRKDYISGGTGWWTVSELKKHFARQYIPAYERCDGVEKATKRCHEKASQYLIINKTQVWKKCGEPRYVVMTFGLGHNHGGTAVMIDNHYNSNICGDRYFNALDRNKAIKSALSIAKARGDTDSIASIRRSYPIHVYMPEAVKCDPQNEAGDGDPFMNLVESIVQVSGGVSESALLLMSSMIKGERR